MYHSLQKKEIIIPSISNSLEKENLKWKMLGHKLLQEKKTKEEKEDNYRK